MQSQVSYAVTHDRHKSLAVNSKNVNSKPCLLTSAFALLNQRFELSVQFKCPSCLQSRTLAHHQTKRVAQDPITCIITYSKLLKINYISYVI